MRETLEDRLLTPSCSAWRLGSGHLWHLSPPSPAEVLGLKRVWEAGLEGGLRCHLVAASEQWRGQSGPASLRALRTPGATTLGGHTKASVQAPQGSPPSLCPLPLPPSPLLPWTLSVSLYFILSSLLLLLSSFLPFVYLSYFPSLASFLDDFISGAVDKL